MSESPPTESVQSDAVTDKRIKEILDIKHKYIDTRASVKIDYETGQSSKAESVTILKGILDSFLLDLRPLILNSQYSGIWNNHTITTLHLEQNLKRENTMLSKPTIGVPEEIVEIEGLQQMVRTPATIERQYRYVTKEFDSNGVSARDMEAVREKLGVDVVEHPDRGNPSSEPLDNYPKFGDIADADEVDVAVMSFNTLDDAYGIATEVLAQLGIVTQTEEEKEPHKI